MQFIVLGHQRSPGKVKDVGMHIEKLFETELGEGIVYFVKLECALCLTIKIISRIHEIINAVPPIGVIAPSHRVEVRLRV